MESSNHSVVPGSTSMGPIDLVSKIEEVIRPWRLLNPSGNEKEMPPFNEEQLVVMALTLAGESRTWYDVLDWILDLPFYQSLSRVSYFSEKGDFRDHDPTHIQLSAKARQFRHRFEVVKDQYEVPLTKELTKPPKYSISRQAAERFLQPIFGQSTQLTKHSFWDLPPELRNSIYEYVFQYPASGLVILTPPKKKFKTSLQYSRHPLTFSRSLDDLFDRNAWHSVNWKFIDEQWRPDNVDTQDLLYTRDIKDILTPLLVNRQFYEEAMPYFYSINRFHFPYIEAMYNGLATLAPSRRRHIAHISFEFALKPEMKKRHPKQVDKDAEIMMACESLLGLSGLRRLDICYDEHDHTLERAPVRLETKGLERLQDLHGLQMAHFHGDCHDLEAWLKPKLTAPRLSLERPEKRKIEHGACDQPHEHGRVKRSRRYAMSRGSDVSSHSNE